jgi:hypothetical protein
MTRSPTERRNTAGLCRLFLRIGDTSYGVTKVAPRPSAVLEGWRLTRPDGVTYDVGRDEQGCSCDCADFTFRREGMPGTRCKHIRALVAVGLMQPSSSHPGFRAGGRGCDPPAGPRS